MRPRAALPARPRAHPGRAERLLGDDDVDRRGRPRSDRALPAGLRAGHGQGHRGHDVLPLAPPDRARRGRRQPALARRARRRGPAHVGARAGRPLPARHDDALDARHQAQRGRARAPARDRRGSRRVGRRVGGGARPTPRSTTSTSRPRTCSSRRCSEPGRSSRTGSSSTWRRPRTSPSSSRAGTTPTSATRCAWPTSRRAAWTATWPRPSRGSSRPTSRPRAR